MSKWTLRGGAQSNRDRIPQHNQAALRALRQVRRHAWETAPVPQMCDWYMIAEPQSPCTLPMCHGGDHEWEDSQ